MIALFKELYIVPLFPIELPGLQWAWATVAGASMGAERFMEHVYCHTTRFPIVRLPYHRALDAT